MLAMTRCALILGVLMKRKDADWFEKPVPQDTDGYFEMIKNPMDYGTIKTKLEAGGYPDADAFASDVRLVASNAVTYPNPDSNPHPTLTLTLTLTFTLSLTITSTPTEPQP